MNSTERVLNIPVTVHPKIMMGLFGLALFVSVVMGVIYLYHWRKYAVKGRDVIWAEAIYFIGVLVLLALIFVTAFLYTYG